jgi:putative endopeptidase
LGKRCLCLGHDRQLEGYSLDDWKTYLRWCLLDEAAPYLSDPFVDEDFKFSAVLSGTKQNLPRWQRVAAAEDRALGFAVGKLVAIHEMRRKMFLNR